MYEKLCNNLNQLMVEKRINASELARRTNLPASTIKKIRNCDNPNPTLTTLLPLASYFSITLSQLVGDEPLPQTFTKEIQQNNNHARYQIPLLTWEEAIHWPNNINQLTPSKIFVENLYSEYEYALSVEEDNWEKLAKGGILFIDPAQKPSHRDFVIVYKQGQKDPTLKQVLYDEDQIYLKPVVPSYHVTIFTPEHKFLGVVMEYRKQMKKISTSPE